MKSIKLSAFLLIYSLIIPKVYATIDLTTLDLRNFQFFKYPQQLPNHMVRYNMKPPASSTLYLKKTKAVFDYFHNLLFDGKILNKNITPFVFDPHFGERWQSEFQKKYGYRGENLVAVLGNGHSLKELYNYGAI